MIVVLCLDQGYGYVGLVVENVVGELGFASGHQFATDYDPAFREIDLFADLRQNVPSRLHDGWRDELGANITFTERPLVEPRHVQKHPSARGYGGARIPLSTRESTLTWEGMALEMGPSIPVTCIQTCWD